MAWSIISEDILPVLQERLRHRCYCNSEHLFLDAPFMSALMKHFPEKKMCLAEYEENDEIVCAFVISYMSRFQAESFIPEVGQISAAYVSKSVGAKKLQTIIHSLFQKMPSYLLVFLIGYQDPDIVPSENFSEIKNVTIDTYASNTSIPGEYNFKDYWAERPKKVRKEIERIIRKLERENTTISYQVITTASELQAGLQEYARLESKGWKGQQGSAVEADNLQGEFYSKVLQNYIEQGQAKIHQLRFGDKVVASLLTIEDQRMIIVLKTTYDESLTKYSPGRLIDYYMLKDSLENTNKSIENYTSASALDQKWFPRVRGMYHVTVYRHGWLMQLSKLKTRLKSNKTNISIGCGWLKKFKGLAV